MEASCAIVNILQTFPNVRLPDGYQIEPTGQEKQALGILVTSGKLSFRSDFSSLVVLHVLCNISRQHLL